MERKSLVDILSEHLDAYMEESDWPKNPDYERGLVDAIEWVITDAWGHEHIDKDSDYEALMAKVETARSKLVTTNRGA